jgi:hypothetical protein
MLGALKMKIKTHLAILLAMGSMTAFAGAQTKTHKLTGVISDSKCGAAKHDAACVKKCINAGAKPVFVGADKKVWSIDDPDSVANYYGDKVKVTATVDDTNNSIHIDKVKKAHSSMSSM